MDLTILNNITYGMYVISTKDKNNNVGCIINTVTQITSENPIIAISLNKDNYTHKVLKETKKCCISILSEKANKELIGRFGYFSSKDIDKFKETIYEEINNMPVVKEGSCAYIIGDVIDIINVKTHDIFLIRVKKIEQLTNDIPMTYKYYHEILKGKSPEKAPTYIREEDNTLKQEGNKYKCIICGYIYDDDKEEIKFEDLPDDWKCPLCGVGKDQFIKL